MRTLRKSELELDGEVFVDCDTLDREELLGGWFANDKPPVRHLLVWVEGRDNRGICVILVLILVSVAREGDLDGDGCTGGILALSELVCDVERGV